MIKDVKDCSKIEYFKFDGEIMFDILISVSRMGMNYEED